MKIYGLTVTKNEMERYFEQFLLHHLYLFSDLFVYDDRSRDGTPEVASSRGAVVKIRDENSPSFLEHEGNFRQDAWNAMEEYLEPTTEDWIVALDADEFLVSPKKESPDAILASLREMVAHSSTVEGTGVSLSIPEVFLVDEEGVPWIRIDGYWGSLRGTRLCRYQPNSTYPDLSMASGSVPNEAMKWIYAPENPTPVVLLHYGYADPIDRKVKYERYKNLPGHSSAHIESILQPPVLEKWTGTHPGITIEE